MEEAKPRPIADVVGDRAVVLVVVPLLDRLRLLQAVAYVRQEFICSAKFCVTAATLVSPGS